MITLSKIETTSRGSLNDNGYKRTASQCETKIHNRA